MTRTCDDCRFWSQMIAQAGAGTKNPRGDVEALCLGGASPNHGEETTADVTCTAWAKNSHGSIDQPPDYGEAARAAYEAEAAMKHGNGAPMFAADGTMLDDQGNRSVFDDVDEGPNEVIPDDPEIDWYALSNGLPIVMPDGTLINNEPEDDR